MDLRNQLDGYRLEVVRRGIEQRSILAGRTCSTRSSLTAALNSLPDDTVIDGEVVAIGPDGRPDFNRLQNFRGSIGHLNMFFGF
ncbi:MAG TPA: hypothetical protein VHT28_09735 [Silvibacterium sp.]|nr:hypothetical protein [Silvibacterium sp.]